MLTSRSRRWPLMAPLKLLVLLVVAPVALRQRAEPSTCELTLELLPYWPEELQSYTYTAAVLPPRWLLP